MAAVLNQCLIYFIQGLFLADVRDFEGMSKAEASPGLIMRCNKTTEEESQFLFHKGR